MLFSRRINHFIHVVNAGSFVKASEQAFVTSSALRHSLSELETEIGSKLVFRYKNSIKLTEFGRKFHEDLMPFFKEGNDFYRRISNHYSKRRKVNVMLDGFYSSSFSEKMKGLLINFDIEFNFIQKDNFCHKDLLQNLFDISICTCDDIEGELPESIVEIPLCDENLGILVSDMLMEKHKDVDQLIKNEPLLQSSSTLSHSLFKRIKQKMRINNMQYNIVELPDIFYVLKGVSSGAGFSLIDESVIRNPIFDIANMQFIPKPFPFDITMYKKIFMRKEDSDNLIDIISFIKK